MSTSRTTDFTPPPYVMWPPFYTLQPLQATRQKQMQMWAHYILEYCQFHKVYTLDLLESTPVFRNDAIGRRLPQEGINEVIAYLVSKGNAIYEGKAKNKVRVYWRKPDEWAATIYRFVRERGLVNTVCTFFEIQEGHEDQDFYQLDTHVLREALEVLQREKKASIFGGADGSMGVKFLPS